MAVVNVSPTYTDLHGDRSVSIWTYSFTQAESGTDTYTFDPIRTGQWTDVSIHCVGTSGTVTLGGTNEPSPTGTYAALRKKSVLPATTATASDSILSMVMSATALIENVLEQCVWLKPVVTGTPTAGANKITIMARRATPMRA